MTRTGTLLLLLALAPGGCLAPAERVPLPPVPQDGQPISFPDALTRLRLLAASATEAFYVDNWDSLADAARSLEQSAGFLRSASGIPEARRARVEAEVPVLVQEARRLVQAAEAKDVKGANEHLQRIHLQIRTLQAGG